MLPRREVAVERADAELGAPRDVVERGVGAVLGERVASSGEELLVVAARVGALGALREERLWSVRGSWHSRHRLEKRREAPYTNRRDTPDLLEGSSILAPIRPTPKGGLVSVTPTLVTPARPIVRPRSSARANSAAVLAIILATLPDDRPRHLGRHRRAAQDPQLSHFSPTGLSWVQNAYTLTFGGLLLLGARAGDILGRRRMLIAGLALFTAASLAGGLAPSAAWLLGARAVQGIGAAIAAPSTLALLTTTFREGPERTRAIAYYSAVAGGGGSVGLVLGGMLTDWVSWRWGLFINVPSASP